MANKSLFTVQYSHALDKFFLTEKENPEPGTPFDIPIIDCENGSPIEIGSFMIDKEIIECSKPFQLSFANPFNIPPLSTGFGLLYNCYTALEAGFAPQGWHLPDNLDIMTLNQVSGGASQGGGNLKCTGFDWWNSPNKGASDSFGFSAPGSGYRFYTGPIYSFMSQASILFSGFSGEGGFGSINFRSSNAYFDTRNGYLKNGYSIRFVKDNNENQGLVTDYEGRKYPTVTIGDKVWTAVNWKSAFFFDGTPIPFIEADEDWAALENSAYCKPLCSDNLI